MTIKQLTNAEFLEFSKSFKPSSIYQTIYYAFAMNEQNYSSIFLGLMDGNEIKAASLILVYKINGFKYAIAPRGFLINYNDFHLISEFTKLVKKYLGKNDIVAVKINPMIIRKMYNSDGHEISYNSSYDELFNSLTKLGYFHMGYNNYFEALKPRFEAIIDLNLNYLQLFGNINRSCRNKIRKAVRDGIKVYHGEEKDLEYLYTFTKKKYPRSLQYYKDLYKFFGKDNLIDVYYSKLDTTEYLQYTQKKYNDYFLKSSELSKKLIMQKGNNNRIINEKLIVDQNVVKYRNQLAEATEYLKKFPAGIVTSAVLIIKWQDEIYLAIDGYDENYRKFGAKQLMIWKLMGRYAKLGYKKFHLGGVSNINKANNKYKGLNEFKLNFHANVTEYAGDFELITNSPLYFVYKNSFGITGMFNK
jgi:peptidoglycan pentaglycine glycine transferase (the second and third glycine)